MAPRTDLSNSKENRSFLRPVGRDCRHQRLTCRTGARAAQIPKYRCCK
jgi:hypothetical protein